MRRSRGDLREADPPVREEDYAVTVVRVPHSIGVATTQLARTALPPAEEHVLTGVVGYGARVMASHRDRGGEVPGVCRVVGPESGDRRDRRTHLHVAIASRARAILAGVGPE